MRTMVGVGLLFFVNIFPYVAKYTEPYGEGDVFYNFWVDWLSYYLSLADGSCFLGYSDVSGKNIIAFPSADP